MKFICNHAKEMFEPFEDFLAEMAEDYPDAEIIVGDPRPTGNPVLIGRNKYGPPLTVEQMKNEGVVGIYIA